jgi:hypothetical protein
MKLFVSVRRQGAGKEHSRNSEGFWKTDLARKEIEEGRIMR